MATRDLKPKGGSGSARLLRGNAAAAGEEDAPQGTQTDHRPAIDIAQILSDQLCGDPTGSCDPTGSSNMVCGGGFIGGGDATGADVMDSRDYEGRGDPKGCRDPMAIKRVVAFDQIRPTLAKVGRPGEAER